ncbi:putative bifunctional diguanylate cyclase/phosphodiesterase [Novosphingobium sp. M1R2S20]|uniref:Bifunctional diguanylate cyclase/phosphodiesterase n=1 Tax=Novosphingobium rhizovicinum TaxID=3228928 RepID=A0ABV3REI8_9SPHN
MFQKVAALLARGRDAILGSLERRLLTALVLIIASTVALQAVSQSRAVALGSESENLGTSITMAEHSTQLLKLVVRFRLLSHSAAESAASDAPSQLDELTDVAMDIGQTVNKLRLDGAHGFDWSAERAAFDDLDRVVAAVTNSAGAAEAGEGRVDAMLAAAAGLAEQSQLKRDEAYAKLERSTHDWHSRVILLGTMIVAIALGALFDVLYNILPALRRMHGALHRLAQGELELAMEKFKLRELDALSRSLETFRRNALQVRDLAFTDPATGLPNRRAFVERSMRHLRDTKRTNRSVVVAFDIDRFKFVNDDYGHAAGDTLVRLMGERVLRFLGEDAIVARIGGDEFAILCTPTLGTTPAAMCSALAAHMRDPFDFDSFSIAVTISAGFIETQDEHGDDINLLLNRADLALYSSKRGGRNRVTAFTDGLEEERALARALERDLPQGLAAGELRVVYQPIYSAARGMDEVEALVRWRHHELGDISPAKFIPAAERSGLMPQLGAWIIERALTDLSRWAGLSMSLNLSPLQLQQDGFVSFLLECCRKNQVEPTRICLEVTETISIERNTRALLTLELLRGAGFRIALDDFGTGYSSLCMMKTFDFDRLKLDRSLVEDVDTNTTSLAVFNAAVNMARQIGAEVVAEGVSEEHLVATASEAGCTHLQGFHLSAPVEADMVAHLFAAPDAGELNRGATSKPSLHRAAA